MPNTHVMSIAVVVLELQSFDISFNLRLNTLEPFWCKDVKIQDSYWYSYLLRNIQESQFAWHKAIGSRSERIDHEQQDPSIRRDYKEQSVT